MASFKQRYDEEKKKKVLGMLKELTKRIKNNELTVETHGFWKGTGDSWTFKVTARESEEKSTFLEIVPFL